MEYHLNTEELREAAPKLRAGDRVLLSGTIYTARDAAHKRFFELLDGGQPLPIPLEGAVITTPAHAGPAGDGSGGLRPHDLQPHEQICPPAAGSGAGRHHRQRGDERGDGAGHRPQRRLLLCRRGRRRGPHCQVHRDRRRGGL